VSRNREEAKMKRKKAVVEEYEARFLRLLEKLGGRISVSSAGSTFI